MLRRKKSKSTQLQKIEFDFEGQTLNTIIYRGKPCWVAKEVGSVLGYGSDGSRLIDQLSDEWKDEFVREKDFVKIEGLDLANFKELFKEDRYNRSSLKYVSSLTLLFEPGLYLVIAKTNKPAGKKLRRKVADEILPFFSKDTNDTTTNRNNTEKRTGFEMELQKFEFDFDGQTLNTIIYRGRPCWVAKEVGNALGYPNNGRRLANKMLGEWNSEFMVGKDFVKIEGSELVDFKALFKLDPDFGSSLKQVPNLILLFEPGLYLVLAKTNKPAGKALRRKIADDILPQISRDGKYIPDRKVDQQGRMSANDDFEAKKTKLLADLELLKIEEEKARSELTIAQLRYAAKNVGPEQSVFDIPPVQTTNAGSGGWMSPTQISKKFGVDLAKVGFAISSLGIRGDIENISCSCKVSKNGKEFTCFKYSPTAVEMIRSYLFPMPNIVKNDPF